MTRDPPYTLEILRLAASLPIEGALVGASHEAEARSVTCGSSIRTGLRVEDGRIVAIGQDVTACAYGQASAALVQGWAPGRLKAEVIVMRAAVKAWLEGRGDVPDAMIALAPVQGRTGRHGAVLLPFDAVLKALETGAKGDGA